MRKLLLGLALATIATFAVASEIVSSPDDCAAGTWAQPVYVWKKDVRKFVLIGYKCVVEDRKHFDND